MPFSFVEWYKVHGKRLNEARKARYNTDEEYRRRVLETNQKSREAKREATGAKVKKPRQAKPPTAVTKDGVVETLLTIHDLAGVLGCSVAAIRLWERQGVIPPAPIRRGQEGRGGRLYTQESVDSIRSILASKGRLQRSEGNRSQPRPLLRYIRFADGKVVSAALFLVGELAKATGKSVAALEQLETKGILPKTPFKTSSVGRRLYTKDMIDVVCEALRSGEGGFRLEGDCSEFKTKVVSGWMALGVKGARILEGLPQAGA